MANKKNKPKKSSGGGGAATSKEMGGGTLLTSSTVQGSPNGAATTSRLNDEDEALRSSMTKKPGSSQLKGKHHRKSIRLNSGKGGDILRSSTQEEIDQLIPSQSITSVMKAQSTFEARSQTLSPDKRLVPSKMI
jgi:hypothetical protein